MPLSKLENALAASAIAPVFPVRANHKTPQFKGWQDAATTDRETITHWFGPGGEYEHCNIGVATGRGVFVVDADGETGRSSLDLMEMEGADIERLTKTPSGGYHAWFRTDQEWIPNSVRTIDRYPGVDIRGDGGYVLAPGSSIDGKPYSLVRSGEPSTSPEWLETLVLGSRRRRDNSAGNATPLVELDTEGAIEQAKAYLLGPNVPMAIQGDGGDYTTYKLFQRVKDFGISLEMALELVDEHWNAREKALPPWDLDELRVKAENAYAHGQEPPGSKSAMLEFDAVEIAGTTTADAPARGRFKLWSIDEAKAVAFGPRKPALVEDVLDQNTFACMFGGPGTGKTFAAMHLGYCISVGAPWDGKPTACHAVVHILAEGSLQGAAARLAAVDRANGGRDPQYFLIKDTVDLRTSNADVKALVRVVRTALSSGGISQPVGLIIIDTLNQAFAGGNENATEDMSAFVANVKKLMAELSTAALVIHHSGKDEARGARGSTVLLGAIDTEIQISRPNGGQGLMENTKQRDLELFKKKRYAIDSVELGNDAAGRPIKTGLFRFVSDAELEMGSDQVDLPAPLRPYYRALESAVMESPDGVTREDWEAAYVASMSQSGEEPRAERTLRGYRADLMAQGFVMGSENGRFTLGTAAEIELPRRARGNGKKRGARQQRQKTAADGK